MTEQPSPPVHQPPQPAIQRDGTRLVTDPGERPTYTSRRTTDAHRALTRGVAEYIRALAFTDGTGRAFRLSNVLDTWAEPEDLAAYPCGAAYAPDVGAYDESGLTPGVDLVATTEDGYTLRKSSELKLQVYLDLYATDPNERTSLTMAVEDAFVPVDWIYGARLALPHYFGVHAEFALASVQYFDGEDKARQRLRVVQLVLDASLPVLVAVKLPQSHPKVTSTVSGEPLAVKPGPGVTFMKA